MKKRVNPNCPNSILSLEANVGNAEWLADLDNRYMVTVDTNSNLLLVSGKSLEI